MAKLIHDSFVSIKKNPTIAYSVILIVSVMAIVFFNAYYSLQKFQQTKDALLQKKAIIAEDIFRHIVLVHAGDAEALQSVIDSIKESDSEISGMSVLLPTQNQESFRVVADTDRERIGTEDNRIFNTIAWQSRDSGVAFLDSNQDERFWTVVKPAVDMEGQRIALVTIKLSLADADAFTNEAILRVYVVAIISMIIVLLLISNHARLFRFAIRAAHLEEVDRMKDDFISMASHELKSPLTALHGYIDLMGDQGVSEEERNHYVQNMKISVLRLQDLVSDLLDVSRIEQNRVPVEIKEMDIVPLVNGFVEEMQVNAREKGLNLSSELKVLPLVNADIDRTKQIVVNLLSNAIKYTQKGTVIVSGKEDAACVYITVADTGIGMSADHAKKLFEKFYRIANDQTRHISGTGLGLWISRQLAQRMNGDITVESIEGVGSHFTLRLPKVVK